MIKLGTTIQIIPFFLREKGRLPERSIIKRGKVVYINREHDYFMIEFPVGHCGKTLRESFKFSQIGTDVFICG